VAAHHLNIRGMCLQIHLQHLSLQILASTDPDSVDRFNARKLWPSFAKVYQLTGWLGHAVTLLGLSTGTPCQHD
jgi:hypothetical protein